MIINARTLANLLYRELSERDADAELALLRNVAKYPRSSPDVEEDEFWQEEERLRDALEVVALRLQGAIDPSEMAERRPDPARLKEIWAEALYIGWGFKRYADYCLWAEIPEEER